MATMKKNVSHMEVDRVVRRNGRVLARLGRADCVVLGVLGELPLTPTPTSSG